jgi:hypothetical protein
MKGDSMKNYCNLKIFPIQFMPFPFVVKCKAIGFVDYLPDNYDMPLIMSILNKTDIRYKWHEFRHHEYPNTAFVSITFDAKMYDEVLGYIKNTPIKVKLLYGSDEYEKYSKCVEFISEAGLLGKEDEDE